MDVEVDTNHHADHREHSGLHLSALSIHENCRALKEKLAQAMKSQGCVRTQDILHHMISNLCPETHYPFHWLVYISRR